MDMPAGGGGDEPQMTRVSSLFVIEYRRPGSLR